MGRGRGGRDGREGRCNGTLPALLLIPRVSRLLGWCLRVVGWGNGRVFKGKKIKEKGEAGESEC